MINALAMAALLVAQGASPPAPRCLTRQQIGDLSVVTIAITVEAVRNACRPHLPSTAFLATQAGADFSARLRAEGRQRLDSAMAGAARIAGGGADAPALAARGSVEAMMTEGMGAELSSYADAPLCRDANEVLEISATLSPDQMARFVSAFASIADRVSQMTPPPRMRLPAPPPGRPMPASLDQRAPGSQPPTVVAPSPPPPGARGERPPRPPLPSFLCRDGA